MNSPKEKILRELLPLSAERLLFYIVYRLSDRINTIIWIFLLLSLIPASLRGVGLRLGEPMPWRALRAGGRKGKKYLVYPVHPVSSKGTCVYPQMNY